MGDHVETIVFGGGCFWCTEAVFKMIQGVLSVTPGYAGGHTVHPTYDDVSTGKTGHAEVVRITYDPSRVKYEDLLTVFFGSHDPTTLDKQGPDAGTQYRSVIFYTTEEQRDVAQKFIADINASHTDGSSVVTEVKPLGVPPAGGFYDAEEYHKDYFANNPENQYCAIVINPKLEKVQKQFGRLLKKLH